jgi:hypothetical protein
MQARVDICQRNLRRYEYDLTLLHRIVAIDEMWLKSYDPKDPKSAAEWRLPEEKSLNSHWHIFQKNAKNFFITFL